MDQRSKSAERPGKLLPAVSQTSRERAEALKKVYGRPTTSFRRQTPSSLPPFSNERKTKSAKPKGINSLIKRSKSESRGELMTTSYGRSPGREKLDDLRDELHETKKKMAAMEIDKKKLNTQMQRIMRDSEKREKYLQRLVTSKFQPAALNDTHVARTLTEIRRNEISKNQLIQIQARELELLRQNLAEVTNSKYNNGQSTSKSSNDYDSDWTEQSDYPEEPDMLEIIHEEATPKTILKTESTKPTPNGILKHDKEKDKEKGKQRSVDIDDTKQLREKSTKRLQLAKAYADQNAKLKDRLKMLKESYALIEQQTKEKEDEMLKQVELAEKLRETKDDYNGVVNKLTQEKEQLVAANDKMTKELNQLNIELARANGEIDALKMENEHLQNVILDLESRVNSSVIISGDKDNVVIPKLEMKHLESIESTTNKTESDPSLTDIDVETLASVLAEIAGSHVERTRALSRL